MPCSLLLSELFNTSVSVIERNSYSVSDLGTDMSYEYVIRMATPADLSQVAKFIQVRFF